MKTLWKTLLSAAVLGIYFLLATATSYEDDFGFISPLEGRIINAADSCELVGMRFVYETTRSTEDTLLINPGPLAPGDTSPVFLDSLAYRKFIYVCNCPNDTAYIREMDITITAGSNTFDDLLPTCD